MAKIYAKKFNVDEMKWRDRLWGEYFFEKKTNSWSKTKTKTNKRGFVKFIIDPILKFIRSAMKNDEAKIEKFLGNIGLTLT